MDRNSNKNQWINRISEYILPIILITGLVLVLSLLKDSPAEEFPALIKEQTILETAVGYVVMAIEIAAVMVIGSAAMHAILSYIRRLFDRSLSNQIKTAESIRLRMGHQLSLGLEFAVASDILRLTVSPSARDIIILFAIILLRILLNYFLEHDIQMIRDYNLVPELDIRSQIDDDDKC